MEIVIFAIPFITAIILLIFFRKQTVWFEYLFLLVPSIIIYFALRAIIVSIEESSTEYIGGYATSISHYDAWDEWVHKTCTRRIPCGSYEGHVRYTTVTYDCSHRVYHPEKYVITDNDNVSHDITKAEYVKIAKEWGTQMLMQDMHRKYYTIDGDMQYYKWDNNKNTVYDFTYPHTYKNKVKVSKSIFNFEDISEKDTKKLGLYDYPEIYDRYKQDYVLGYNTLSKNDSGRKYINYINAVYGPKYQFRTYILIFKNKDISISEKQKSYWVGGNKNEFIICIGIDSTSNKIKWANAFSWCDKPSLEIYTEQFLSGQDSLNIYRIADFLSKKVPTLWKRKEFKDFDYIGIELKYWQYILILVIITLYNIGCSIYVIKNNFKNE